MQFKRNWYFLFLLFFVSYSYAQERTDVPLTANQIDGTYRIGNFQVEPHLNILPNATNLRAGLLYDADKGVIVWEKNAQNAYPMASITKMMVALLAVEDVNEGKYNWDSKINYTVKMRRSRRSKKYYDVNVSYTLKDMLTSVLVSSNNTNAEQMADFLGGTRSNFIVRMNRKAKDLGMNNTLYSNPSGLPEKYSANDNKSSPHDLLILALETMKHPELMEITKLGFATVQQSNKNQNLRNTNRLTIDYKDEVDGMKTGYTRNAKYCLVASSKANERRLISIVLGAPSISARHDITAEMKNNYFYELGLCQLGEFSINDAYIRGVNKGIVNIGSEEAAHFHVVKKQVLKTYTVRRGQNLSVIAEKLGVSLSSLKKWNRISGSRIYAGQKLKYYTTEYAKVYDPEGKLNTNTSVPVLAVRKPEQVPTKKAEIKPAASITKYHTVTKNQTLSHIAQKYQVSVSNLMKWNSLSSSRISVGQKLAVSNKAQHTNTAVNNNLKPEVYVTHNVKSGESLSHIADKYNVYIKDIKAWNNLTSNTINVGQKIKVYTSVNLNNNTTIGGDQKVFHVVQKGDTVWDIAQLYDGVSVADILKENNITNSKKINPGTKLKIPVK